MNNMQPDSPSRRRWFNAWFGYVVVALICAGGSAYGTELFFTADGQNYTFQADDLNISRASLGLKATPTPTPTNAPKPLSPYDQSIRQQDIDGAFRSQVKNASTEKVQLVYADLTNDRIEDALVSLRQDGTGGYSDVAVYTMSGGKFKQLWRLPQTDVLAASHAGIGANQSVLYYGAEKYDGAATRTDTYNNYIWNGTVFAKVTQ